ncbi:MAG: hypothetical protein AB8D78_01015 [Akkermansiaceae bacterium]
MNQFKRYLIVGGAVLVMGLCRMPLEQRLTIELEKKQLLPPKLEVKTSEKIGQTFTAVSLGGLRTLVATFLNLRAFTAFSEQKWAQVAENFDTIVDLAPRTRYYWDTGAWHQAYNAASYYLYESDQSPLRRKLAWKESILYGRDFLERGIRNNPDDHILRERLGALLADSNRIAAFGEPSEAYEQAYEVFMEAVKTGNARQYAKRAALYSLGRVPGREADALKLLEEIKEEQGRSLPTMLGLQYTLSYHQDPEQPVMELIDSVFPSRKVAYEILGLQWQRTRDRFPVYGIATALALLESQFGVEEKDSILKQELRQPMDVEDYFQR